MSEPKRAPVDELLLPSNFRLTLAEQLRGLEGLPSYLVRRRRIEDLIARALSALRVWRDEAWALSPDDPAAAADYFFVAASSLDLTPLAELIASHNRYYPIEANLPSDVRTGRYLDRSGEPFVPMRTVRLDDLLALL